MNVNEKRKKRQNGEGSVQCARKKMRAAGQSYVSKKNKLVEAKLPPSENVSYLEIPIIFISIH